MSDGLKHNGESRHRYRLGRSGGGSSRPEAGGSGHVDDLAAAYALGSDGAELA